MSKLTARMELCEAILTLIQKKRAETHDESLGFAIERVILDNQFQEIEAEILEDPGAFDPWLIRRQRN
jgi:hypothetical protein